MTAAGEGEVVVLARGSLMDERARLAVRVALAIPLGGAVVSLILADTACALGLEATDPGAHGAQLHREIEALIHDEEVPVMVEAESLEHFGLSGLQLRPGVTLLGRLEVEERCRRARCCLVI